MSTKVSLIVLIILIVAGIGLVAFRSGTPTTETPLPTETVSTSPLSGTALPSVSGQPTATVKNFTVVASNFAFNPKEIRVKKGDTVTITLDNKDGFHDLRIDEFNIGTKKIQAGGKDVITFVADRTGSFEYYCTVGNHRAMGMWGTLIVE